MIQREPGYGLMGQHGIFKIGVLGNQIMLMGVLNIVQRLDFIVRQNGMIGDALAKGDSSVRRTDQSLLFKEF